MSTTDASRPRRRRASSPVFAVHVLDMGKTKYGDCLVVQAGDTRVLIDGGHPGDWKSRPGLLSIPQQIGEVLQQERGPYSFDLLIVTHTHADHIGCLPTLVETGQITADWALVADPDLGYGEALSDALSDAGVAEGTRVILAALREESHARDTDPAALWEFLLDAGRQQTAYREMLETLRSRGTRVVEFRGSDDSRPEYGTLLGAFRSLNLEILGPTRRHLDLCAQVISASGRDLVDAVRDAVPQDGLSDTAGLYRSLADSIDASGGGLGAAINDQSIVAVIGVGGRKALLTGDMQLAKPGVPGLDAEMKALRGEISGRAPYDLVKIAHHAAENAFDESVLGDLKESGLFAISTGRDPDDPHPSPKVLRLLDEHRDKLQWVRNDRNGRMSLLLHESPVVLDLRGGRELNDKSLNGTDAVLPPARPPAPRPVAPQPAARAAVVQPVPAAAPDTPDLVEVIARIPHRATRVTLTIDIQPQAAEFQAADRVPSALRLASGRILPPLLFVTSTQTLASRIGGRSTDALIEGLGKAGMRVLDLGPESLQDAAAAAASVQLELKRAPAPGVVLIGGYDVLPSQTFECLDPGLKMEVRQAVALGKVQEDPDDFVVWSDDIYGDVDASGFPDLPVSRVPDGGSAALLWSALESGPPTHAGRRCGLRNFRRPFADTIFQQLPGAGDMLHSEPAYSDQNPPIDVSAEHIYLMLHGEYTDASAFLGESSIGEWPRALTLNNIPKLDGAVIFAGCCWGALPVREPAVKARLNASLTPHTAESSMALRFLASGARAFVGCTGVHYSPGTRNALPHFGSPMHDAFWRACCNGHTPAEALLRAKVEYLRDMPHGMEEAFARAVELKTLRQFTCLGLGW